MAPVVAHTCVGGSGTDTFGHGTNVAGVAAALNNSVQGVGVAHGVSLWSAKIGNTAPNAAGMACGVQYGRNNGVSAINISAAVSPSTAVTDQINAASYQNGIVVVASVGNGYGAPTIYPASLAAVVGVGAVDINNTYANFSNTGSGVDLVAPGVNVPTTCLGGGFPCNVSGTSFAAAHVSATAALLKAYNPAWNRVEIIRRINATLTDLGPFGWDPQYGYGLLNVGAAVIAPPALNSTIDGPSTVRVNTCGTWHAVVSGGATPYSYEWSRDYTVVSQYDQVTLCFWGGTAGTYFTLYLRVLDASGQLSTNSMFVNVTN